MPRTKKANNITKSSSTKKRSIKKSNTKDLVKKLEVKSKVFKNMLGDLTNNDTLDIKNFIVNEVQAKYYKDLIQKRKNEVYKIIDKYLETDKVNLSDTLNSDTVIGVISVARLLEIKALFKETALFFVKRFDKTKLRKKDQDQIYKLIDLVHPEDIIVKETFKKKGYYDDTIFDLFKDFVKYSIDNDVNHMVLKDLFNMGFSVKSDYSQKNETKINRPEQLKNVIQNGSLKLFKILVENGRRNTNVDFDQCHMLNWAVFYDKLDIVKYLIEKEKHNVNKYCNNSYSSPPKPESATPLYNAVLKQNPRMVRYLISKNADVNLDSNGLDEETAAFLAVKLNNLQILKMLVRAGADLDTQTPDGSLAYDLALSSGNQEMINYLLKNKARTEVDESEIRPDYNPY